MVGLGLGLAGVFSAGIFLAVGVFLAVVVFSAGIFSAVGVFSAVFFFWLLVFFLLVVLFLVNFCWLFSCLWWIPLGGFWVCFHFHQIMIGIFFVRFHNIHFGSCSRFCYRDVYIQEENEKRNMEEHPLDSVTLPPMDVRRCKLFIAFSYFYKVLKTGNACKQTCM